MIVIAKGKSWGTRNHSAHADRTSEEVEVTPTVKLGPTRRRRIVTIKFQGNRQDLKENEQAKLEGQKLSILQLLELKPWSLHATVRALVRDRLLSIFLPLSLRQWC